MCATVSLLVGLDAALAVVVIVVTTALVPLTLPAVALPLLGLEYEIDLATFMLRLGWMVGAAFAVALVARRLAGPARLARSARALDAVAVLSLLAFAVAIMDGVTAAFLARPGYVLGTLAAAFAANLVLQAAGTLAFLRLGLRQALTIGLMTGNCNIGPRARRARGRGAVRHGDVLRAGPDSHVHAAGADDAVLSKSRGGA